MYEDYFGLERPPFKITPDTSLFYEGGKRGDILAALVYAIHRGEGIIKVVGEVGSGKTMLCRMLQLKLPETVEIVYIANPSVSAEDILFVIAHELSLPVGKDASKHEVMHMLQDYLLQRHTENKQVVLFVEEAQGMPLQTLEEIRLLSNLETDEHKLMQIILFGQPELDENLSEQSIRQLRERITHNFELEPLTQDEIHNYLNFRMRQVGYTGPELISNAVAKKIEQHSEGLLRRINIIADKILLSAFAEGTHNLNGKHVTAAVNDSAFSQEAPRKSHTLWWWLVPLVIALAIVLYQTRAHWLSLAGIAAMQPAQATLRSEPLLTEAPAPELASPATGEMAQATEETAEIAGETPSLAEETAPATHDESDAGQVAQAPSEMAMIERDAQPVDSAEQLPEATASAETRTLDAQVTDLALEVDSLVQEVQSAVQADPESAPVEAEKQAPEAQLSSVDETPPANLTTVAETRVETAGPVEQEAAQPGPGYRDWLNAKLEVSRLWLDSADRRKLSIQVMMRKKSAARELVYYLRNEWPLDISQTHLYEVEIGGRKVYRVFYSEFDSLNQAQTEIDLLPDSVKVNSPYVHSVNRMRRALL